MSSFSQSVIPSFLRLQASKKAFWTVCYFKIKNWSHIATHILSLLWRGAHLQKSLRPLLLHSFSCRLERKLFGLCIIFWSGTDLILLLIFCLLCCWGAPIFKKAEGSVVSNWIEMKGGRNVLQVIVINWESDFRFYITLSRWWPWEKCCNLVSEHEASAVAYTAAFSQFLIYSTPVLLSHNQSIMQMVTV